jgi:hypothetical protein
MAKALQRDRVCANCEHFLPDDDDPSGIGECHRHPPNVLCDSEGGTFWAITPSPPDNWCGEHKAKH